jgi:pSer/pThr/pTyr-binding forkhead associated (FHA) protein
MTGANPAGVAPARCPACGHLAVAGMPFCPNCGKRVTGPAPAAGACPHCGTPPAPGAAFCAACGKPLDPKARESGTSAFAAKRADVEGQLALLDEAGTVISRHALAGPETTVGRSGADIEFRDDLFLSPLHAQISVRNKRFIVRDLGSRNGTWRFIKDPQKLEDGDLLLIGSQVLRFRRLGYPGPHPPEDDATRRMGSLTPSADIAKLIQLRSDGSERDAVHLSPGRNLVIGRDKGDWIFPYDPSMSGSHAEVRSEDADFVVVDLGSRNGVALAVRGDASLEQQSRFLVGDKMLRLEIP